MQQQEKKKKLTREQHENREWLLKDRLAICLMLLKQRHGNDWEPWFGEACWDAEDSIGDVMRQSKEYPQAHAVVELFITRSEK